eukprot:1054202-Pyramimonas_sp.AAC.1
MRFACFAYGQKRVCLFTFSAQHVHDRYGVLRNLGVTVVPPGEEQAGGGLGEQAGARAGHHHSAAHRPLLCVPEGESLRARRHHQPPVGHLYTQPTQKCKA